jgi:hypothetical protein
MHLEDFIPYYFVSGTEVRCPLADDLNPNGSHVSVEAPVPTPEQIRLGNLVLQQKVTAMRQAAWVAHNRNVWLGLVSVNN